MRRSMHRSCIAHASVTAQAATQTPTNSRPARSSVSFRSCCGDGHSDGKKDIVSFIVP
jgi:hypothetical protein